MIKTSKKITLTLFLVLVLTVCICAFSASAANVLIRGEAPTHAQSAVILDLVMRETGLTGGNVKIIPVK